MTRREEPDRAPAAPRRPRPDEIDVHGLTHIGHARTTNQDHFLIGSLDDRLHVHRTSLPGARVGPMPADRLAVLAMVADGVGGGVRGEEASRFAIEALAQDVARRLQGHIGREPDDDAGVRQALEEAALRCHAEVLRRAHEDGHPAGMATTLTLWLGVWPRAWLLQVGDSRYYRYRDGTLSQVSRDQTVAQELVDTGMLSEAQAARTRWAHVLSSAIGGQQTAPLVTCVDNDWSSVHLLCSDGLTRHVSDERIREHLAAMASARETCEALLHEALEAGGTDNITIVLGRAVPGAADARGGDHPA